MFRSLRPYSQAELKDIRDKFFRKMRIGDVLVTHSSCEHEYYARKNGRKEKLISEACIESNCSVCWRIKQIRAHFQRYNKIRLTDEYQNYKKNPLTYYMIELEKLFYTWLYT